MLQSPASRTASPRYLKATLLLAFGLAVVFGALQLEFICDDAFITFRYVSNAHDGLGLVWNPPPFQPVEGYTGFLWALLLWATWSRLGVEPPIAANCFSASSSSPSPPRQHCASATAAAFACPTSLSSACWQPWAATRRSCSG
jgi:hypothetical protein